MAKKIEILSLSKSLNGKMVLDNVDLSIDDGETFSIIGQSGVGKSVLIKHIIGLIIPDRGKIYVDGERIDYGNSTEADKIRRKFGMLFQGGALFDSLSVGDNILFALDHLRSELPESRKQEMMLGALELVELPGIENLMISSLSGGMMKRVALARAIVAEPSIILFDEPTTGLDPITTANINELIIHLKQKLKTTFVIVTHDINSARFYSDRIGMIYGGKIIFTGTPDELVRTENPYVRQFIEGKYEGPITDDYNAALEGILHTNIKFKKRGAAYGKG
ncbi:MAG: ATP-binding cassette domain-containing protein [Brevinematales bacterium]|jgi:phospholipid/cholesterol/gamma-HCH transport system ATP-binding protein